MSLGPLTDPIQQVGLPGLQLDQPAHDRQQVDQLPGPLVRPTVDMNFVERARHLAARIGRDLDVLEEAPPEDPAGGVNSAAPNTGPIVEPSQRAVNGFVRVTYHGGSVVEYYVGLQPAFIADQLLAAKAARRPIYCFWDKPGHRYARRVWIVPALVKEVQPRFLEADIDSLYEDDRSWLPSLTERLLVDGAEACFPRAQAPRL